MPDVESTSRPDAISLFERQHHRIGQLCDVLEGIADLLPEIATPLALSAAESMRRELPELIRHEEDLLFPLLAERAGAEETLDLYIERFRQEHLLDEGYACEVLELLDRLSSGDRPDNPDLAGYLLRGYFISLRRHLFWEGAIAFPLARKLLTKEDMLELRRRMVRLG